MAAITACASGRSCCWESAASRRWPRSASHPASCTSTKATARLPRWSWSGGGWRPRASSFDEAMRRVSSHVVFTTHTPVPAGHDRFAPELIEEHLGPVRDALGLSHEALLALGRVNPQDWNEEFCMTVLALKSSHRANAVSSLHGHVSRAMWTGALSRRPGRAHSDRPRHQRRSRQFVAGAADAPGLRASSGRGLARAQRRSRALWEAIDDIDDGELWEAHLTLKARLVAEARRRLVLQAERLGQPASARRATQTRAEPRCTDDRVCPAICHVQAGQSPAAGSGRARSARERSAPAGAADLRGEGASARRPGENGPAGSGPPGARSEVRRQDRVHRGLRHQRRPRSRPGRGRVVEQPAAAARGMRDQRAEGRAQRRA